MDSETPANFDPVARPYRWLEYLTFGPYLQRCRFHFLGELSAHRRALVLGDGDGRFTARLLAANPEIAVDAVDSSATMLRLLENRAERLGPSVHERLRTFHIDALAFRPEGPAHDLVATHFFLDCLTEGELSTLLDRVAPHLSARATWLISDFAIPTRQPIGAISGLIVSALYFAFRVLTGLKTRKLPDYAALLRRHGFRPVERKSFLGGLLVSELWLRESPEKQPALVRSTPRWGGYRPMPTIAEVPAYRAFTANSYPNPEPDPNPDPEPDPDPVLPAPGSPVLIPGFPIEPIPEPVPLT